LRDGFTTLERGLILAAPILAAATAIGHFWQKDVEERAAFANQRSEHLRIELLQHQAKIAALEKKLEARETSQNESRSPTMPAEPASLRDPFDNVSGVQLPAESPSRTTGLQRWRLDQLRLAVIVTDTRSSMAMFEDPENRGWPLHVGDHIGDQGCTVTAIERDRIRMSCPLGSQSTTVPLFEIESHPMGDFPVRGGPDNILR